MRKIVPGVVSLVMAAIAVTAAALTVSGDQPVSSDDRSSSESDRSAVMGTVAGVVTTSAGQPLGGAAVRPRSLDVPSPPIPELAVSSDPAGRYRWRLRPGRYELAVSDGDRTVEQPVTVTAGQTTSLNFVLP